MRYRVYLTMVVVLTVTLFLTGIFFPAQRWIMAVIAVTLLTVIALCYRSVAKPLKAVGNGLYLLTSHDFGSRLRKTGQHDADKVINLFNGMMDTLKTERLKLMEQNLLLVKLMEVSPLGIAICDFDDNIIETNEVFRKLQTTAISQLLADLRPNETRVTRHATSQVYRCSRLSFMDTGFQRTCYIIEVLTEDIVELERAVFRTIVRTIGHEVNNTLGPVISVLDSLGEMNSSDPWVNRVIAGSKDSCRNLVEFVRGYANVVKLPAPILAEVDLSNEIKAIIPVLQTVVSDNVKIRYSSDNEPFITHLDMMLIERAIVNIVKNAAESIGDTAENGMIDITLDREQRRLTITDNGQGLSEETSARVFTPFFSTKRPDRGLGLMLVADILRSHGATFSLATDKTTGLTTFSITLSAAYFISRD
ncbi:MAG: hypothetical protein K2L97_06485 [Muribaculaceae bacterium]|nr:hypothetical protein [Muribaculaceae bacterium]